MRERRSLISLSDLTCRITKGTTPTSVGGRFTDDGINYFKIESIDVDGALLEDKLAFIDDETHDILRRSQLEVDDVLFSIAGAIGRTYLVRDADLPANTNQALAIVRFDRSKIVPRYGYYAMRQREFQGDALGRVVQTAQANVNLTQLSNARLTLRSITEQQRIVDVVANYDDLIENNRRRIALLEEAARQLYREWFVRLRFPGHEHTGITNGVPEAWERTTAYSAIEVLSGGTPKTTVPDYWDGEIPFYTPKDASDTAYVLQTERAITELGLKNCNSRLYELNTVFITSRGTVGKLNLASRPMAMSQSCYALIGRGHVTQLFLFCALKEAIEHFKQHAVGAVFDAIVVDTFKLIPFMLPDEKMIRLFEEAVAPMFRQVANLMEQHEKLRTARDLLLPRLMSGEIAA